MLREIAGNVSIVAATKAMLDAEDHGGEAIAALLGVTAPVEWPPEHNDADSRAWFRGILAAHPDEPGCGAWYLIADNRLCGTCGFKGPPDAAGVVEIGYSVLPIEQRRGHATAGVRLLVARAFRDSRVTEVAAETLPSLPPSQGVLLKCGFTLSSRRHEDELGEVWRYALTRADYARSMRAPLA